MTKSKTYPAYFKPQATSDLVRIGNRNDGGYILPSRILTASRGLMSFGLNDDCTFEKSFADAAGCRVVCFDHTVDARFWSSRIANSLVKTVWDGRPSNAFYFRRLVAYRKMFVGTRHKHIRKAIGYGSGGSCTLAEAISIAKLDEPFFLKIDIEGWEYRILEDILKITDKITGLALEMHDIDLHETRVKNFITKFSESMILSHFHPNSAMLLGRNGESLIAELTFMNRNLITKGEVPTFRNLPIVGLDAPNLPGGFDYEISFD